MLDRVYLNAYSFLLRMPSRTEAREVASFVVALAVIVHLLAALMLASEIAHVNLLQKLGKAGVVAIVLATLGAAQIFFFATKRADRLLTDVETNKRSPGSFWIGLAIVVWTFALPFLTGGLLILLYNNHIHIL